MSALFRCSKSDAPNNIKNCYGYARTTTNDYGYNMESFGPLQRLTDEGETKP